MDGWTDGREIPIRIPVPLPIPTWYAGILSTHRQWRCGYGALFPSSGICITDLVGSDFMESGFWLFLEGSGVVGVENVSLICFCCVLAGVFGGGNGLWRGRAYITDRRIWWKWRAYTTDRGIWIWNLGLLHALAKPELPDTHVESIWMLLRMRCAFRRYG